MYLYILIKKQFHFVYISSSFIVRYVHSRLLFAQLCLAALFLNSSVLPLHWMTFLCQVPGGHHGSHASYLEQAHKEKALQQMQQMSSAQIVSATTMHGKAAALLGGHHHGGGHPGMHHPHHPTPPVSYPPHFWQPALHHPPEE